MPLVIRSTQLPPKNYSISIDGDVRAREGAAQLSRLRTTKGEGMGGLPNPPAGEPYLTCKRPMEIGKDGILKYKYHFKLLVS